MKKELENKLYDTREVSFPRAKNAFSRLGNFVKWGVVGVTAAAAIFLASCANPLQPPIPGPSTDPKSSTSLIDFSKVQSNLWNINEGQKMSITMSTTDKNQNPVTYTDVTSLNPNVATVTYNGGNTFDITGNNSISADEIGDIQISYIDNGVSGTEDLGVKVFDLVDLSGEIVDSETGATSKGIFKIKYKDSNGTTHIYEDVNGNQIIQTPDGYFNVRLPIRTKDIEEIDLEGGLGDETTTNPLTGFTGPYLGPSGSWTRVLTTSRPAPYMAGTIETLSLGDNSGIVVSATPTGETGLPLNPSGKITTDKAFQQYVNDAEGPYLYKYGNNGQNLSVEIAGTSSYDRSTYVNDSNALSEISDMATQLSNIIPGGIQQHQTSGTPSHSGPGYEVIMPAEQTSLDNLNPLAPSGSTDGSTTNGGSGEIGTYGDNISYVLNTTGNASTIAIHELAHGMIEPLDLTAKKNYTYNDSIFYESNALTSPTNVDIKLTKIVYNKTYKGLEEINKYILKNGFN